MELNYIICWLYCCWCWQMSVFDININ